MQQGEGSLGGNRDEVVASRLRELRPAVRVEGARVVVARDPQLVGQEGVGEGVVLVPCEDQRGFLGAIDALRCCEDCGDPNHGSCASGHVASRVDGLYAHNGTERIMKVVIKGQVVHSPKVAISCAVVAVVGEEVSRREQGFPLDAVLYLGVQSFVPNSLQIRVHARRSVACWFASLEKFFWAMFTFNKKHRGY